MTCSRRAMVGRCLRSCKTAAGRHRAGPRMPVMDGAAFRQQQLLQPDLAAIPVIVLSADRELDRHCLALRPYACLSNPFLLADVLAALASACAQRPACLTRS